MSIHGTPKVERLSPCEARKHEVLPLYSGSSDIKPLLLKQIQNIGIESSCKNN